MKKTMMIMMLMFVMTIILAACGDDDKNEVDNNNDPKESNLENKDTENDSNQDDESEATEDEETSDKGFDVEAGDQLDLTIGDTGTFDTTLGTYEVTLVSAKLEDTIDGAASELDRFIRLDITVKNTSEEEQKVEDLLYSLEVTDYLDGSGFSDASEHFDSLEKMSGTIGPGEEMSGQIVTFVYDAEEYYFRKDPGNVAAGSSNQVIWTIKADEAQ
ncbi:DUF4352 domain-containing protein [Paucisalibacillus globulus]|uniref:DUF4352 domain-containing protein n=1 Tax=Paucisalibacillus globulus TaxID=351095 RepID=UPI000BB7903E|nr:DUF4352 domain-containing protein [Paucisalibacillus globulus]